MGWRVSRMVGRLVWAACGGAICSGCVVGGRANIAAATAIDAVVDSLSQSLGEYHDELTAADEAWRLRAVDALIARIRADAQDDQRVASHRAAFVEALRRLGDDERVEWQRYATSLDHLAILEEIGEGLERMARESSSLDDEYRRHLMSLAARAFRSGLRDEAAKR